jgi:peptidoglycan/LPS O-acetylase OafA/YrhL
MIMRLDNSEYKDKDYKEPYKILSLQALRAMAFLGIFLCHSGAYIDWSAFGVSIFFVLSGFLMYYNHRNEDFNISLRNNAIFSWNHIKKLYPLHLITMCLAILLEVIWGFRFGFIQERILSNLKYTFLNILLMQSWVPNSDVSVSLNGVAWYLSTSLFLYFIFPVIAERIKKRKNETLTLFCTLVLIFEILVCIPWICLLGAESKVYIWFMYCFPVFRLGDYYIGSCLGKCYADGFTRKNNCIVASLLEIVATAITVLAFVWMRHRGGVLVQATHNWTTLYIPLASIWIVLFAQKGGIITKILCNRALCYLGDISPYVFLIHYIVIMYTDYIISYNGFKFGGVVKYTIITGELLLSILLSECYKRIKYHVGCHKSIIGGL